MCEDGMLNESVAPLTPAALRLRIVGAQFRSPSMSHSDVEEGLYCPDWGVGLDFTAFLSDQSLLPD
jgi:hypothetical protein